MRQDILNELSKMYAITYSLSKQSTTINTIKRAYFTSYENT